MICVTELLYNVVIIWKWRVLSVHFLTANGEEYIFRENSAIWVIIVSYILFFISCRILTVSIRDILIGITMKFITSIRNRIWSALIWRWCMEYADNTYLEFVILILIRICITVKIVSWSASGSSFNQCWWSGSGIRFLLSLVSGMGRKSASGSGIRDEQPGSYFLEVQSIFFWMKYLNSLVRIRDLGWRLFGCGNWDPGSGIRDGKMSLTASGINMPDSQQFIK
jgi:hypothetical protein